MTTNPTTTPAVQVRGLRRTYGSGPAAYEAVRGIDLDVPAGSITALLGTNGAGKTSTLELVEGLATPSAGSIRVLGLDPLADRAAVRRRVGVLLQRSGFSGDLTVRETLRLWHGTVTDPRPVDEMLALLSLDGRADTRMLSLSGGETRRVDLACTLMGRPELVVLDEPTTGLDPESRRDVWQLVADLRAHGSTVLLTTHYLDEAEALADRLEIMHAGEIVRSGTATEIAEGHPSTISFDPLPEPPQDVLGVTRTSHEHGRTTLETTDLQGSLQHLLAWADRHGVRLGGLDARSPSLESVFLAIADGRDPRPSPAPDTDRPTTTSTARTPATSTPTAEEAVR